MVFMIFMVSMVSLGNVPVGGQEAIGKSRQSPESQSDLSHRICIGPECDIDAPSVVLVARVQQVGLGRPGKGYVNGIQGEHKRGRLCRCVPKGIQHGCGGSHGAEALGDLCLPARLVAIEVVERLVALGIVQERKRSGFVKVQERRCRCRRCRCRRRRCSCRRQRRRRQRRRQQRDFRCVVTGDVFLLEHQKVLPPGKILVTPVEGIRSGRPRFG
mmetsp:Transcript_7141/g.20732  ORF Transcript_7141/g.20732 Transcript_7141/m.20732 type:complete len:215 (+) Transcript_7141:728-1372(+)